MQRLQVWQEEMIATPSAKSTKGKMMKLMSCPRCHKSHSQTIRFYFQKEKVRFEAHICQVCEYIWAEDEELLKAARKHLYYLARQTDEGTRRDK